MKRVSLLFSLLIINSCSSPQVVQPHPGDHVVQPTPATKYNRKTWKHWLDEDRDCLNTRAEILKERSLVPVTMKGKGCTVNSGKWNDYYYPEVLTSATKIDIDHLIPLKYAYDHGGASWNPQMKEKFANDPENLVITNRRYNRQKGAKGIDQWLPVNKAYACKYVSHWIKIKNKYELPITSHDQDTIRALGDCD